MDTTALIIVGCAGVAVVIVAFVIFWKIGDEGEDDYDMGSEDDDG